MQTMKEKLQKANERITTLENKNSARATSYTLSATVRLEENCKLFF